jgi:hypothetical protein
MEYEFGQKKEIGFLGSVGVRITTSRVPLNSYQNNHCRADMFSNSFGKAPSRKHKFNAGQLQHSITRLGKFSTR